MRKTPIGDAMVVVITGSGPTAPTVAAALYHLAQRPDLLEKLNDELQRANSSVGLKNHSQLANIKLLYALIKEALRLHRPIRSGLERMTLPKGMHIGETFVP